MGAVVELKVDRRLQQGAPDYLPARMINEWVYCPRLFHFEQVLGVFADNEHTVEGSSQHKRVDRETKYVPQPGEDSEEPQIVTSLMLSSEADRVIAKLDLAEFKGSSTTPVDYKRGKPMRGENGLAAWPADRVQLAVQAIVLRANGYQCDEGVIYYQQTKQRVRIAFDEEAIGEAKRAIAGAWAAADAVSMPPPLVDSPKCPGCSLVGICLPDETVRLQSKPEPAKTPQFDLFGPDQSVPKKPPASETRLLVTPRADLKPLYLNTHGLRVGKSGDVLKIKERDKVVQEARINEICQVNVFGNVQITTQALQALCIAERPICYFSMGGWFYGVTSGMSIKNVVLRKAQILLSDYDWYSLRIARALVAGKIKNQRTMLLRNHIEPPELELREMRRLVDRAENVTSMDELLGVEGYAARIYFGLFSGMIKGDEHDDEVELSFDFTARNRRPPRDPINAMLSYGYSLLAKDLTVACYSVGFDPMIGFYHQPRHGRPALALDLMEPMRPLIADSAVLSAVNTRMIGQRDFVTAGKSVAMNPGGRKAYLRAYEGRMDTLVTHPDFDYRVSYRRLLEIQARLLAKTIQGELSEYPVFVTR